MAAIVRGSVIAATDSSLLCAAVAGAHAWHQTQGAREVESIQGELQC
jgi:hypothetical protein